MLVFCFLNTTDFEMRIPGMNFCGPGTNLLDRLEADTVTPKSKSKPVDRVDEATLRHECFIKHTPVLVKDVLLMQKLLKNYVKSTIHRAVNE